MPMSYHGAIILSGEGERGTYTRHTGKPTWRAISRRLAQERCQGDRWATAMVPTHALSNPVYLVLGSDGLPTGDMRDVDERDID